MASPRLLLIGGCLLGLVAAAGAGWFISKSPGTIGDTPPYTAPSSAPGDPVRITVQKGEGARKIGDDLENQGVIESATQFEVLVALEGYNGALQAGEYEFQKGSPVLQVIDRMRHGIVSSRTVTVVEGWRIEQIADAAAKQGISRDDFLAAASSHDYDFDFVRQLQPGQSLEGYLYPATYPVLSGESAKELVRQMLQAFQDNVPQSVLGRVPGRRMNLTQVLTLASIIEREARIPGERPVMAQVFLKRLSLGMPLQADPTVQYAIATPQSSAQSGWWKVDLTEADLKSDSPYNTYTHPGLPPGPICNPSLDSVVAVLQPAATDYLYFVAKPDGSHAFARTLAEHEANVAKYGG